MANKLKPIADSYEDKYRAEDDARTLEKHGEIMGDSDRHQKAMVHVEKKKKALDLVTKVQAGMKKAFPEAKK